MQRRRFLELTTLSATGVASTALAGCTGASGPGTGGSDTTTSQGDQTTTTTTTTMPSDTPCPQVRDVSMHVCPGDDGGPISVDRSAGEMPADGGTIAITVTNTTDSTVGLNPYAWAVHRRTDAGDWERVDDPEHIEPWRELAPGDSLTWVVASDEDHEGGENEIACALDFDPGTYGWTVELKQEGVDKRVAAAAGFVVS